MLCAGISWLRSTIWASGLMPRMTPFMLPTNTSEAPKSVNRVMMGGGLATESSARRGIGYGLSPHRGSHLFEADIQYLVFGDLGRRLHFQGITHALADQCASDR